MMDKRKETLSQITKEEHVVSYREKITELVWQIEDVWILNEIFRFIENITK